MKKILFVTLLVATFSLSFHPGRAQEHEAAQLILNLEKLNQLRNILQKMYEGYQVIVQGYNKVKDITSGNFQLHDVFLDGLYLVNPAIKSYHRVGDIVDYQLRLVKEYKSAYNRFKSSGVFDADQLAYLLTVYENLFNASLQSLDDLLMVITARQLRMSDSERLAAIDRIANDMERHYSFLRQFNSQQGMVVIAKLKEKTERQTLMNLYDFKD